MHKHTLHFTPVSVVTGECWFIHRQEVVDITQEVELHVPCLQYKPLLGLLITTTTNQVAELRMHVSLGFMGNHPCPQALLIELGG